MARGDNDEEDALKACANQRADSAQYFGERERKRADLNVLLATAEGLRESREAGTSEG